jgi:hypothetical protein
VLVVSRKAEHHPELRNTIYSNLIFNDKIYSYILYKTLVLLKNQIYTESYQLAANDRLHGFAASLISRRSMNCFSPESKFLKGQS